MRMEATPAATRLPNGDLLIPAATALLLRDVLQGLQDDLVALHGKAIAEPGELESADQTAHRQQAVESLSAAAGVKAPTVEMRQMPDVHSLANSTRPVERLSALRSLLFGDPG